MDIFAQLSPIIAKNRATFMAKAVNVDDAVSDENLASVAAEFHATLPFALRMALKKDMLASLLINNRDKLRALLE